MQKRTLISPGKLLRIEDVNGTPFLVVRFKYLFLYPPCLPETGKPVLLSVIFDAGMTVFRKLPCLWYLPDYVIEGFINTVLLADDLIDGINNR